MVNEGVTDGRCVLREQLEVLRLHGDLSPFVLRSP